MSSVWMCHVVFFCIFLCKAMWSTAHGYYFTGAGHSVPLKQFTHPLTFLWGKRYLYKTYLCSFNVVRRKRIYKNMNSKILHDMLVNWLYSGIRTLLLLWWAITVEPVFLYRNSTWILIPTKCIRGLCCLKKDVIQKHLSCKKGKAKKVQITEQLKGVKSLWGQDIPARLCRTPAYKAS